MSASRLARLLGSARARLQPAAPAADDGRRQFFRRSAAVGAAAVGAGLLLPGQALAHDLGIPEGTVVDAAGNVVRRTPLQGDPLMGTIILFGGNFAPRGWALCEGQLLPISQNSALFSILGTTYGGDGRTTFALPDLRGRVPIQQGNGPGLPSYRLGQKGGNESTTLTVANLAAHNHNPQIHGGVGTTSSPAGNAMAVAPSTIYGTVPTSAQTMAPTTNTGGGQSFSNQPPYLAINFIIALQGIYPSRS